MADLARRGQWDDPAAGGGLGEHPTEPSTPTRGGTMTFTNVGAPGWWPRRIDREAGDPACTYKDGTDTWGGHCCMKEQHTTSTTLAPFDEEMTLIMKAIRLKQLAVYQPGADASSWSMVSSWDAQSGHGSNLVVTEGQMTSADFTGDLTTEIRSPVSGLLAGIRRQPLLCEGDLVARVLVRGEVQATPDTYLMGHGQ